MEKYRRFGEVLSESSSHTNSKRDHHFSTTSCGDKTVKKTPCNRSRRPRERKRYSSTLSSTSVLDVVRGQRHVRAAASPGKRPGTHCTGDWVQIISPPPRFDPGPSSLKQVAIPTELPRPTGRGEFRPRQTRQLPRAVDLKGRLLSCQSY